MDDEARKRLIAILSSGTACGLAGRLADKLIEEPEIRECATTSRRRF